MSFVIWSLINFSQVFEIAATQLFGLPFRNRYYFEHFPGSGKMWIWEETVEEIGEDVDHKWQEIFEIEQFHWFIS